MLKYKFHKNSFSRFEDITYGHTYGQTDKSPLYALTLCKEHTKILHCVQGFNFLTLSKRSTMMQVNPKVASHSLVSGI
jgi:hypothetical protein